MTVIQQISISTIDNPGWRVELSLTTDHYSLRHRRILIDEGDKNWLYHVTEKNTILLYGDQYKLVDIFEELAREFTISKSEGFEEFVCYIKFLQTWYANQCDGDWEHTYGIKAWVDTDGYCQCTIDLFGTWSYLDEQDFKAVGTKETFYCHKVGEQLVGEGKVEYVTFFLKTFKEWLDRIDNSYIDSIKRT